MAGTPVAPVRGDPDWVWIGRQVAERREKFLRSTKKTAPIERAAEMGLKISLSNWKKLEAGEGASKSPETWLVVAAVLGWPEDARDYLVVGQLPPGDAVMAADRPMAAVLAEIVASQRRTERLLVQLVELLAARVS